jgi:ribosomal protein S25
VNEPEPAPKPTERVPNEPIEANPLETPTAQIPANEPLPENNEPIEIPPFDNAPTPLPPTGVPAPSPAGAGRSGRDLLVKARATIQDRKRKKLERILSELDKRGKITNDEVEKLLHVSDATATRYLSTLEKEGKIQQVGKTGKAVEYTRI